jgi:hypothetical protein
LMETPVTRLIDRMDDPSTSMERIWTRVWRGSLFMPLLSELFCLVSSMNYHDSHTASPVLHARKRSRRALGPAWIASILSPPGMGRRGPIRPARSAQARRRSFPRHRPVLGLAAAQSRSRLRFGRVAPPPASPALRDRQRHISDPQSKVNLVFRLPQTRLRPTAGLAM